MPACQGVSVWIISPLCDLVTSVREGRSLRLTRFPVTVRMTTDSNNDGSRSLVSHSEWRNDASLLCEDLTISLGASYIVAEVCCLFSNGGMVLHFYVKI